MHDHPKPRCDMQLSPYERAQQLLLLELVVDPPPEGDLFSALASRLDMSPETVAAAACALSCDGLAVIDGTVVRASPAALRFEALWPVAP